MARTADVVLADSAATAALVRRHLGVKRSSLHVVYAAAQGCFRQVPTEEARRVADQVFGLRQKYILCVSTIEPRKEHLTLLRAVAHTPGVPLLVLVGGLGWRCRSVLGQIRVHERAGRVKYLGRVDEKWLPGLYSAATLSVYPSLYEGFGLPVLESMACGCPVVCSDSSSLPEVGGSAVRCFRTGDHADLARVLTGLLRDDGLLKRMSAAGLRRAEQFSFRTAGRQILGLIRQGVGRIGRPRDESAISLAADTTHQAGAVERAQVIA
jgi:glycosyltransferase involved in cell wall biosynthesis